ncbi:DUF1214 domain-containing protein [Archaeoglobus sp.]
MKKWLLLSVLAGVAFGIVSAYYTVDYIAEFFTVKNGAWKANLLAGSEKADIYTRAAIALNALFALNRSEAVYFIAHTDSNFNPLRLHCDYRIEGGELPARWWSITVYGLDLFLIPNEYDIYAVTSESVEWNNGKWVVKLSQKYQDGNWIPLRGEGNFILVLRLYNPDKTVYESPQSIELPKIILERCR